MSIPRFLADLAIIQKLSDLPNSTEGLTAAELKARFDAAGLATQKFINEQLVPSITADNIPFTATNEIAAANIYDAILNVHSQVRDAATGAIANGSVTTEKLSNELMERVFGGRPWVSIDTPDSADNVAAGFPIGQLWLRPRFTVTNAATDAWTASGCSVAAIEHGFTITGTNTVASVMATQTLANLGIEGDRVFVLFDVLDRDSEITGMTVSLNGADAVDAMSGGVFETNLLASGALQVQFGANWPSTSLADGSVTIANYSVVNVTKVLRQMSEAKDMANWASYLTALQPITTHTSAAEVFIQASNGQWWPFGFETLAVSRGGTGLNAVESGALLVGTGGEAMQALAPGADGTMLLMENGQPKWVSPNDNLPTLGFLQFASGTYKGNEKARTVTLSVTPKLLFIKGNVQKKNIYNRPELSPATEMLLSGEKITGTSLHEEGSPNSSSYELTSYKSYIELSGNSLEFTSNEYTPKYLNVSGETYNWIALY